MMRENNGRPLNKVVMTSEDCQVPIQWKRVGSNRGAWYALKAAGPRNEG